MISFHILPQKDLYLANRCTQAYRHAHMGTKQTVVSTQRNLFKFVFNVMTDKAEISVKYWLGYIIQMFHFKNFKKSLCSVTSYHC